MEIPDDQWAALVKAVEGMDEIGRRVVCAMCGKAKNPYGRAIAAECGGGGCNGDCEGYYQAPFPCDLFPGEKRSEFGYGNFDAARVMPVFRVMRAITEGE